MHMHTRCGARTHTHTHTRAYRLRYEVVNGRSVDFFSWKDILLPFYSKGRGGGGDVELPSTVQRVICSWLLSHLLVAVVSCWLVIMAWPFVIGKTRPGGLSWITVRETARLVRRLVSGHAVMSVAMLIQLYRRKKVRWRRLQSLWLKLCKCAIDHSPRPRTFFFF